MLTNCLSKETERLRNWRKEWLRLAFSRLEPEERKRRPIIDKLVKKAFGRWTEGDFIPQTAPWEPEDSIYERTPNRRLSVIINRGLFGWRDRDGISMGVFDNQLGTELRVYKEFKKHGEKYKALYQKKFGDIVEINYFEKNN